MNLITDGKCETQMGNVRENPDRIKPSIDG